MSGPVWSIILASRNGQDTLPRCLSALQDGVGEDAAVEILLVDNASTDQTPDIMQRFGSTSGAHILTEAKPGKAFALNAAVARARGEWLLFIDDDILVGRDWLTEYQTAASKHPAASLLAGQIKAHWEGDPPKWLLSMASIGKACGCTNPEAVRGPYPAQEVKGGNFAIRRSALGDIGFDEIRSNLGASQAKAAGGLDTQIAAEMATIDDGIIHVPSASALHIIGEHEMRLESVFRRQMRIGRNYSATHPASALRVIQAIAKIFLFSLAVPLASLTFQHRWTGRSLLGLATNLGRLQHWLA